MDKSKKAEIAAIRVIEDMNHRFMVVSDSETLECSIYEVKHSSERHPKQLRHILDPEKRKRLEDMFGTIRRTEVLYRGKSGTYGGVSYRNVSEYLKIANVLW